jgi:hypothetical protein
MLRSLVVVLFVVSLVFAAVPTAEANTLPGRPFYVFQNVAAGTGTIFIFTAAGAVCGAATIAAVGPPGAGTLAFDEAMQDILSAAPVVPGAVPPPPGPPHFGIWYTAAAAPLLCGGTSSALNSYYISIF